MFPADNPWNQRVDGLPVAANSAAIIRSIGAGTGLHPDFGSGLWEGRPIGIPYTVVTKKQKKVRVSFEYADESDPGPYPIPPKVKIEGGSDRHALIVDSSACRLYELYALRKKGSGWRAGSGAIWSLRSNALRPAGWTSRRRGRPADPAGARALRGVRGRRDRPRAPVHRRAAPVAPTSTRRATTRAISTGPNLPPMGLRVRLRASFDTSSFPPQARVVLEALKRFGMIVADNGIELVHHGRSRPALVERRPAHARPRQGLGLRGRGHLVAHALDCQA